MSATASRAAAAAGTPVPSWRRVTPLVSRRLRQLATLWLVLGVAGFAYLIETRGLPRSPEGGLLGRALEVPISAALLVLLVVGRLLAVRWPRTGAAVIALSSALLGYLASVLHPPTVAAAVTLATFVPAALIWLSWQGTARLRSVVTLAVATALVVTGVVTAAHAAYQAAYGPTHPASAAPAPSRELVDWMWAGGVTDSSATVRARTREPAERVRLLVSPVDDPGRVVASDVARPASDDDADPQVFSLDVDGLSPDTRYSYDVEVDGRTDPERTGSLRTFPQGPSSFTFAVGSCVVTGSDGAVFDAIQRTDPLFFAITGDFGYANIDVDDPQLFRDAYGANLTSPGQAALYADMPIAYVWDDHDYSANDGDRTSESRPAALQAYAENVPHYPLELEPEDARADPEGPIFQAFTVGRVRVVLTDNRSARVPVTEPDGPAKTMLGLAQREALLRELRSADQYAAVVWVNPTPWVQAPRAGADGWGAYPTERRAIADTVAEADVDNLVMVSGDAHMVAFDDGSHTDYSTQGGSGFPLLHAAALDRPGSVKGGPYSGGTFPGGGQFGTVSVRDEGGPVEVTLTGLDWQGQTLTTATVELGSG